MLYSSWEVVVMRIDYSKLWTLLASKRMTKKDLIEMSGISSRMVAKLTKSETVTTDTILRICETLRCNISDVMECVDEDAISVYQAYLSSGKITDENELFKTVSFSKSGRNYTVYVSKTRATKATHIECRDNNTIYWVQFYPFGGMSTPSRVEKVFIKPIYKKEETSIVIIKGKPGLITGLDEGLFVSSRGTPKSKNSVYVMSEGAFKIFKLV